MELLAVIKGMAFVLSKGQAEATVYSDSAYVVNALNKGWVASWIRLGWKKKDGSIVKNSDLWLELVDLIDQFDSIEFVKVKGHSGDIYNEIADRYARAATKAIAL